MDAVHADAAISSPYLLKLMSDKKIDTTAKSIAYCNSVNAAVEICKNEEATKLCIKEMRDWFYQEWVQWRNKTDMRSELVRCDNCGNLMARLKGKRKKDGKPYDFYKCGVCKSMQNTAEQLEKAEIQNAKEQQIVDEAKEEAIKREENKGQ